MKRKLASCFVTALLLFGFLGGLMGGAAGDQEPNNAFTEAESIQPGDYTGGLSETVDEEDYYKFTMAEGQRYILTCKVTSGTRARFETYDPNQEFIHETGWIAAGAEPVVLDYTLGHANAGSYYLKVEFGGGTTTVFYSFTLQILDQSDAGQQGDAGDTDTTARPIQPGTYEGWLANEDKSDYYSFDVPPGNKIDLTLTVASSAPSACTMRIQLYDPNKEYVKATDWKHAGLSEGIIHQTSDITGGTYYVEVEYGGKGGNYTLSLNLIPENDAGTGTDVSGSFDRTPMALPGPGTYEGYLLHDDKKDYYSFDVPNGNKIVLKLTVGANVPSGGTLRANLYKPDKEWLNATDWKAAELSDTIFHQTSDTTGGTYYAMVEYGGKGGNYTLALELIPENDADSGTDVSGDINTAYLISGNGTYTGYIHDDDKKDYYKFNVSGGQIIMFNFTNLGAEPKTVRLQMYRPNKEWLKSTEWLNPGISENEVVWITNNAGAGQWYLMVEGDNAYRFDLTLTDQTDAGELGDAGDDINTARPVQRGENYTGLMGDDDEKDFYSFSAVTGEKLSLGFRVTSGSEEGRLTLYGPDKNEIDATDWVNPDVPTTLEYTATASGLYYILIETGNNEYMFNVTLASAVMDTENPVVTVTYPANRTTLTTATINVTGTASDDVGVEKVEVSLSGIVWWLATGTNTWTYYNLTLPEGTSTIYVRVTDYSGKTNITSVEVTYSTAPPDTVKPKIEITSPKPGAKVTKRTIFVCGTATDDTSLSVDVEVFVNGVKATQVRSFMGVFMGNVTLKEGKNNITVVARDAAGNEATKSVTVTYEKPSSQPGFGALLLLVAVGAGLALLRRRRD
ncbi:MAG: Ig-like domain-containing protein [Thermoplasmata archaeon]